MAEPRGFSARTALLPHQPPAVAKALPAKVNGLLMDMGTGKTRTLIEIARIRQGKWDRLFWFCPVTLRETIHRQWLEHSDLADGEVVIWGDKVSTDRLPTTARVHIIGIETMSASDRIVLAYGAMVTDQSFVVVDESDLIKGDRAKRTQRITHMSARCRYRSILTGTPLTQGVVDLYSQMSFLSPKILGYRSFWSFARNHLEFETRKGPGGRRIKTGRIVRAHNEEWLAAKIAPYIYQVRKDECMTLPAKLHENRWCDMTRDQRMLYEQAKVELLNADDLDDWSPIRIFRLYTALQTILCGYWKDMQGRIHTCSHNRLDLLMTTLAGIPQTEPVIVWAKLRRAVDDITRALQAEYGPESVAHYHGGLSTTQRDADLIRWRASAQTGARFLVAIQDAGSRGLTLNEAAYSVFYADSFKYSQRLQAEDRNHRIGQARRPVYISLRCLRSIDERIQSALERKGSVLTEFREMVQQVRALGTKDRVTAMLGAL